MSQTDEGNESVRSTKIVDVRLPLPYLISGTLSIALLITSMWFKVDELGRNMSDMQITLKAGNSQAVTMAGELALLRYRIENLESDRRVRQPGEGK